MERGARERGYANAVSEGEWNRKEKFQRNPCIHGNLAKVRLPIGRNVKGGLKGGMEEKKKAQPPGWKTGKKKWGAQNVSVGG